MTERNHSKRRLARRAARSRARGFSLTEIMIALAIISMVMGAAAFAGFKQLTKSRVSQTKNMMHTIESAITQYSAETGDACPASLKDLVTRKIMNKEPRDGWNHDFVFKCPSDHGGDIDLTSGGGDGKVGTEDDIHNWDGDEKKLQ